MRWPRVSSGACQRAVQAVSSNTALSKSNNPRASTAHAASRDGRRGDEAHPWSPARGSPGGRNAAVGAGTSGAVPHRPEGVLLRFSTWCGSTTAVRQGRPNKPGRPTVSTPQAPGARLTDFECMVTLVDARLQLIDKHTRHDEDNGYPTDVVDPLMQFSFHFLATPRHQGGHQKKPRAPAHD